MPVVLELLRSALAKVSAGDIVELEAIDPDRVADRFSGERVEFGETCVRCRHHDIWMDVAEVVGARYLTPRVLEDGFMRLRFRKLDLLRSWHRQGPESGDTEKYGVDTTYARIDKFEVASFLADYLRGLLFLRLPDAPRILVLGCNQGDELHYLPAGAVGVGIDHSQSALSHARQRFPQHRFICADLRELEPLRLGRFDGVIAINTLQSQALDGRGLCRYIVKELLTPDGGVIFGLPNSRYEDLTLRYGTRAKHRAGVELGGLVKDLMFMRRYLTQQRFEVSISGKFTKLVVGRRLQRSTA